MNETNQITEDYVVRTVRLHLERKFPKICTSCGFKFDTLADFILNTIHEGDPVSYDDELGVCCPGHQIGTLSYANCGCGSTLALDSTGFDEKTFLELMKWVRKESERRGMTVSKLLAHIRLKVGEQVLGDSDV